MRIDIDSFKGEIPRLHPRLLPDGYAQRAVSCRLEDGALRPLRRPRLVHSFPSTVRTIHRYEGEWLGFLADAKVCPGPVAQDRIYYTGDGAPKVRAGATIHDLALIAPAAAPAVTLGGSGTGTPDTIVYAVTFVTDLDEESQPSPTSAPIEWRSGQTVTVSSLPTPPAGRGVNRFRIYRSQTSLAGVTELFFVAEIPSTATSYVHNLATAPIQEPIASVDYDPPPANLAGLTAMANGFFAAFVGKEIYFSEPFVPHAWPQKYTLLVDHPIVALVSFGTSVAILTTGTPYIAQGAHPDAMSLAKMEGALPCLSGAGAVDIGSAAAYPSHSGLVHISTGSTALASRNLFARGDWLALGPDSFFAALFDGRYYFAHAYATILMFDGGLVATDFASADLLTGGGVAPDATRAPVNGGNPATSVNIASLGMIDMTGEQPFFTRTDQMASLNPTALHVDDEDGFLYILSNGQDVYQFDPPFGAAVEMGWRSKVYDAGRHTNFAAIRIQSDDAPSEQAQLMASIYADGRMVAQTTVFNEAARLPGDFEARRWEIEVKGTASVRSISMATTMDELVG